MPEDEIHSLTCLRQAIYIRDYLEQNLQSHIHSLGIQDSLISSNYGIGIHSGGGTINRASYNSCRKSIEKDFIFGIVVNTVARLQSFTKNYAECNFLVTGNYKDAFLKQAASPSLKSLFEDKSPHVRQSLGRVNLNDGKKGGHIIYALTQEFISLFKGCFNVKT